MRNRKNISKELLSSVLVDSVSLSANEIAAKYGLMPSTVRAIKSRHKSAWYMAQDDSVTLPVLLQQQRETAALSGSMCFRSFATGDYTEAQFKQCVFATAEHIAHHHRWPRIIAKSLEFRLPSRKSIDLLFQHSDGTYTIVEVKSCSGNATKATGWLLYGVIGQLLYYGETVADVMGVPWSQIRLCVVTDYNPDTYFVRSLAHVDPAIQLVNASLFMG